MNEIIKVRKHYRKKRIRIPITAITIGKTKKRLVPAFKLKSYQLVFDRTKYYPADLTVVNGKTYAIIEVGSIIIDVPKRKAFEVKTINLIKLFATVKQVPIPKKY